VTSAAISDSEVLGGSGVVEGDVLGVGGGATAAW